MDLQQRTDRLWAALQIAIQEQAWEEAEGLLRRLMQCVANPPWEVIDTLGYVLLMQGDYPGCEAALQTILDHPQRSFWVSHKLADALRGQGRWEEAIELYRQSLNEGSTSPLTARNLLQVLDQANDAACIAQLEIWQQDANVQASVWEGATTAALTVSSMEVCQWLWQQQRANADVRERLLRHHCHQLALKECLEMLQGIEALSLWERALLQRLTELGVGAATNGPSAA